jgi:orotidine-5'-phosphate decarboxylase
VPDLAQAFAIARQLQDRVGLFKIGSQLFTAEGPGALKGLVKLGVGIFLDLKFHDIPNTVANAVKSAAGLPGVRMMTLHASGGTRMLSAAREALTGMKKRPILLGVTVLTSMGQADLKEVGVSGSPRDRVLALARLAQKAGMDGVVASAEEVAGIRKTCGGEFLIVVPGIRPAIRNAPEKKSPPKDDQERVATPAQAIQAGADYLVIGRPIVAATDPRQAAWEIAVQVHMAETGWHARQFVVARGLGKAQKG